MRLIDADSLHKSFEEVYNHPVSMFRDSAWWFFGKIEDEPTVDAATVVHGRLIAVGGKCKCSYCHTVRKTDTERDYFCPNCGAKMDLPEDGE